MILVRAVRTGQRLNRVGRLVSRATSSIQPAKKGEDVVAVKTEKIEDILRRVRYSPSEDPQALLVPDNRLEPAERWWQKVFTITPWIVFAGMLAIPLLLVSTNLTWLQQRAEARKPREEEAVVEARLPGFEVVSFARMPDILDRPFPTLVFLIDTRTFASQVYLAALPDLARVLVGAGLHVSVAALDLRAEPHPPSMFLWEYAPPLTPYLQLVVPKAVDEEAGVIDHQGSWTALSLVETARKLAGPHAPRVADEEVERLNQGIESFRDALFEAVFVDGRAPTLNFGSLSEAIASCTEMQTAVPS